MSESEILWACRGYLTLKGHFIIRINGGAFKTEGGGFMRCTDTPGTPDILGITKDGKALAVEAKSAKGRMSASQEQFRAAWVARGGVYVIARGLEDLEEAGL